MKIKIGGLLYDVIAVTDLHTTDGEGRKVDLNGRITYGTQQIEVARQITYERQLVTLLHECAHGILEHAGQDAPENSLVAMGYGLFALIRENPELIEAVKRGRIEAASDEHD